jgi:cis-3-alkyl-4-acyloxetan-2-one decarboxylase
MRALPSPGFSIESFRDLYPFKSHFLELGNLKLHYLDEGEGPVVLMVHGNPTWSFYFRNLIQALRGKYRVIVPDHMGCGLSDKPQDYAYCLQNHIQNLEALIEHLGLDKIHLIVHDWGGMIGFGVAVNHPDRFKTVEMLNTCAFRLPEVNQFPLRISFCRVPVLGRMATRILNGFSRGASLMATVSGKMSAREKEALMAPYNSYANRVAVHAFVKDIPLRRSHRSYGLLRSIETCLPLLKDHRKQIIWGMKDFCFDENFLDEWERFYPGISVNRLKKAGHYVLEDAPDEVISSILTFLDQSCKQP